MAEIMPYKKLTAEDCIFLLQEFKKKHIKLNIKFSTVSKLKDLLKSSCYSRVR